MDHDVHALTAWFTSHVHPETVLGTLGLLIFGGVGIMAVTRLLYGLMRGIDPRIRIPYETTVLLIRVVAGTLWTLLGLIILEYWGVSVTGVWTFLASVGTLVGVGFLATWTMISNATANLLITIWRPFRLGQDVEILPENLKGRVIDRTLMFTALREQNGTILQVPNNLFFQKMFRVTASEQYLFEFLERENQSRAQQAGSPELAGGGRTAHAPDRS
jgi:small-conductance mechanosensitive channel